MDVFIDGNFYAQSDAKISVFDHGLLYGDGVFEGLRVINKRIVALDEHVDRLFDSMQSILLRSPHDKDQVKDYLEKFINRNEMSSGYIRLVITRGVGTLGLNPTECPCPSMIIIGKHAGASDEKAAVKRISVITASTRKTSVDALNPQVKSLNYLNNVLLKIEALNAGCQEAIVLNKEGYAVEATGENLFIVKNGVVSTPPISAGALAGITRQKIIDLLGKEGVSVSERLITKHDLYVSDEIFLCGTASGILAVTSVDARVIGTGQHGEITQKVISDYQVFMDGE